MASINITKQTSTTNTTASSGRSIKYIVEHYTAGTSSKKGNAANTASWFANSAAQASADFIVDDETIVQFNPDPANRYCWAVGGSNYNNKGGSLYGIAKNANSISIEICSTNSTGKVTTANDKYWSFTDAVLEKAKELTLYLMDKYNIDIDHVIRHYDVNGKPCPGIIGWNADSGDDSKWYAFKASLGDTSGTTSTTQYYRVRLSWDDASSQLGAFTVLENAKAACLPGYTVYDWDGNAVYTNTSSAEGTQATVFKGMKETDAAAKILEICAPIAIKNNLFPSVCAAQTILESGYCTTDLAQNANNVCGMKCTLSGNTWANSTWDGTSKYTKDTQEQDSNGNTYTVTADFRKYPNIEDSIADRCAYLLGAMNGSKLRYAGITECANYKEQAQLIKDGGYATDTSYVSKLCNLIEQYDLTIYDNNVTGGSTGSTSEPTESGDGLYRVRTSWESTRSQLGAFAVLDNAIALAKANDGYKVFDDQGNVVYPTGSSSSTDENGIDYAESKNDSLKGTYTITAKSGLNLRSGASTSKKSLVVMSYGEAVQCYGYYTKKSGVNWLLVQYTKSSITYTGFASSEYLSGGSSTSGSTTSTQTPLYYIKVSVNNLTIRAGAGVNYASKGVTGIGTFGITEEKEGKLSSGTGMFGRLLSGSGWVWLGAAHVTKL